MHETAQEHFYNKLKEKLLATDLLSSSLIVKASYLKQQDEANYIRKVDTIKQYLFDKMKEGDGIAYAIYHAAHAEELAHISELNNFHNIRDFLSNHEIHYPDDNPYFDPKVVYYAEVLGLHDEL
jgi:hypothetical protein